MPRDTFDPFRFRRDRTAETPDDRHHVRFGPGRGYDPTPDYDTGLSLHAGDHDRDTDRDTGRGYARRDYGRSFDRDYDRGYERDYDRDYGRGYARRDYDRDYDRDYERGRSTRGFYGRDYDRGEDRDWDDRHEDRSFWERARDEVRSWFGDEDDDRRRGYDRGDYGRQANRGYERNYGRGYDREFGEGYERGYGRDFGRAAERETGGYTRPGNYDAPFERGAYQGRGVGSDFDSNNDYRTTWGSRDYDRGTSGGWDAGPYAGRGPRGYTPSPDRIRDDVCERLTHHGHLDASRIQIRVDNAEVTLEGEVDSRRAKRLAEDIAEQVRGVRDVHNRLRVNPDMTSGSMTGGMTGSMTGGRGMGSGSATGNADVAPTAAAEPRQEQTFTATRSQQRGPQKTPKAKTTNGNTGTDADRTT